MEYISPPVGHSIMATFYEIPTEILLNEEGIKNTATEALKAERFNILTQAHHHFEPHGYTGLWLLSESHLAIHTYPEEKYRSLVFDLYSCRGEGDGRQTLNSMKRFLQTDKINLQERPMPIDSNRWGWL
ncbi:MAG: adenosylmethionine decarboxylase [Nanoarchaeota archaeon]